MSMMETWMPAVGFNGIYEVSDLGRVKRVDSGRILRRRGGNGYDVAVLFRNGVRNQRLVHRLVVEAFVGIIPTGLQVNHINGDKLDNTLSNLEIVTPSQNTTHAYRVLNCIPRPKGESHSNAMLSEDQVRSIRREYGGGSETLGKLGAKYGVGISAIWLIVKRKNWKHLAD